MQKLAMNEWRVKLFGLRAMMVMVFSTSAAARAIRFAKMLRIPPDIRGGSNPEELERMGQGIARLKVPSQETLQRELGDVKREGIPLLVVTGGWSPVFEVTGDAVAALGSGRRIVIHSEHHFPQRVSDEFNEVLVAFMKESDAKRSR
jgi:hypothetical protein